jgi:Glycosyl transferases group 1
MKIILVSDSDIAVSSYDDKARVLWWLGKMLHQMGHEVVYLVRKGAECPFATVLPYHEKKPLEPQIPADADLVHFHDAPNDITQKPYLITQYEHGTQGVPLDRNTVFVSDNHARLHGGNVFVYPGVDFSDYAVPEMNAKRLWFHFLGNATKKGRNVRCAIDLAAKVDTRLHVIGGSRVHFRQGLRIPLSPSARFHGTLSPGGRDALLNASKGMVFPVLWQEPFSLAVVESLYFGCPIFGTPFGALPELLGKKVGHKPTLNAGAGTVEAFYSDYGCLSVKKAELVDALKSADDFDRVKCHEFALNHFSSQRMTEAYLALYNQVLAGKTLHEHAPVMPDDSGEKLLSIN